MNPVVVRNIKIGEGIPKICVPVTGMTKEEILNQAESFHAVPADIAEWRADWFEHVSDMDKVKEVLGELRAALKEMPLLFTFRTYKEGGEKSIEPGAYAALNKAAAQTGNVDLIDVEAFSGDEMVKEIVDAAHACGVKVIASNHDFDRTPDKDEIISRLRRMQQLGADITKIAVMPQSRADVLTLLAASEEMYRMHADRPMVTMSMSGMGVISRVCGEMSGSALTFGAAEKASAPGQMDVGDLAQVLLLLHKSM